jgi:small-conductance mechanosensitive channel
VHRPRFRKALVTATGALLVLVAGSSLNLSHARTGAGHVLLALPALAFLVLMVGCARSTASELDALARWRGGQTAGSALRMLVTGFGSLIALMGTLSMLSISVGHFLLGGAILGVVLGIAAQQSLGNAFAGMVLLLAHPFGVGNDIRVRSGALGGEFSGTVTSMTLTYVSVLTDDGPLMVPNSALLSAAVGPARRETEPDQSVSTSPASSPQEHPHGATRAHQHHVRREHERARVSDERDGDRNTHKSTLGGFVGRIRPRTSRRDES